MNLGDALSYLYDPISSKNRVELEDFDILLFSGQNYWISRAIEWMTGSEFSHVGIVLKSPTYLHPNLTGIYLLESGQELKPDAEDGIPKLGVQITELNGLLSQYKGLVYRRRLDCNKEGMREQMKKIHQEIHGKPYDLNIIDVMETLTGCYLNNCKIEKRFFCSALATFVYMRLGLLPEDIAWTIVEPKQFGDGEYIEKRLIHAKLDKIVRIK